jgi:Zn-dependent protease
VIDWASRFPGEADVSSTAIALILAANVFLIFLLMALPVGKVRFVRKVEIAKPRNEVWSAVHPLGARADWSGQQVRASKLSAHRVRTWLSWLARDGSPVIHDVSVSNLEVGEDYSTRIVDDNTLDLKFWENYQRDVAFEETANGTRLCVGVSDSYRGLAFAAFRYFALRRELAHLKIWMETGELRKGGWFEHPVSQFGFAGVSALLFWPLFGLDVRGFQLAVLLTIVVALHELGHMAAFRLMGHRHTRMIFIPILGGIAIGGRPYNTLHEVAFSALMGSGFSAFLIPIAIAWHAGAVNAGMPQSAGLAVMFCGLCALFNGANLLPIWKFDGGQVLRQVVRGQLWLGVAAFAILSAFLAFGWAIGVPGSVLAVAGAVVAVLSFVSKGRAVRPRHELQEMTLSQRIEITLAFMAVLAIHASGLAWAARQLAM